MLTGPGGDRLRASVRITNSSPSPLDVVHDEVIPKSAKPREVVLNVKDAKELRVVVERVGLFAGDQINLGDARLQK